MTADENENENEDGDSDTSGVVSDVTSCGSQELMANAGHTWSNANSMRHMRSNKVRVQMDLVSLNRCF